MTDSSDRLRHFAARLLEHEGALVEAIEPGGLEAMLPTALQQSLRAPEFVRLGFAAGLPHGAQRVGLESDWLDRFDALLGERGRAARFTAAVPLPPLNHPERVVEHAVDLRNAVYRLLTVSPAWTRYLILIFRYTAISDEKREGLIRLGVNLHNGSAIDPLIEALLGRVIDQEDVPATWAPPAAELPPDWPAAKLKSFVNRALPPRARDHLSPFLAGMQRRLDRDLARVVEYYTGLRQEAWGKLRAGKADAAREQLRLEAAAREYQAKVADLRQKYDLRARLELSQTLEVICPVQRIELQIKRRKGARRLALDWNPLAQELEPPPCEWSYTTERARVVCDDALHLIAPTGHAPCADCGKEYCRACHPRRCPKCGPARGDAHLSPA